MTQPTHSAPYLDDPTDMVEVAEAVPVVVMGQPTEKVSDAQLSSYSTYVVTANGASQPVQIVPQDRHRHRCLIIVNGTAGDYVILAKQGQISNTQGARLYVGNTIVVESEAAAWLVPVAAVTHDVIVSVIDERYLN